MRSASRHHSPAGRGSRWVPALAGALALVSYAITFHRGLPGPDAGELIAVARTLGIPHPPGYPLQTMLGHLFAALIPLGSYPARINLLSSLLSALAVAVTAATVARLTARPLAGLTAALALAFSRPFWRVALVTEVFPLNSLMAALLGFAFATLLRDAGLTPGADTRTSPRRPWPLALLVLVTAAIPAHHHTLLLLALPLDAVALAIVWTRRPYVLRPAHAAWGLAAAALGLAPLLYLPLAAARDPMLRWGHPETLSGFVALLARSDYGTFNVASGQAATAGAASHLALYAASIPRDLGWPAVALAALGAIAIATRAARRSGGAVALLAMLLGFAILCALFFARIQLSTDSAYYRGVVERFYPLPDLAIAWLVGLGAAAILATLPARAAAPAGLALAALAAIAPLVAHGPTLDQRGNRFNEDLVRNVLASAPPGAVLFSVGDVLYDGITYRTVCERERPDLVFVDEYLLTRPWYVADVRRRHPGVLPPFDHYTGEGATVSRRWIEHLRGRRPVAFTGFLDRSWGPDWVMIRRGLVWVPYRADSTPSAVERVRTSVALLDSLRLESFARRQDPAGPEAESRPRVSEFVAATCLQLCDPDGRALRLADHRGLASLAALLTRLEDEPALADPPLLRAMGLMRAFHPDFRDRARAARDLAAYLAAGPQGPEAADAARVLDQVRRGGP